MRFDKPVLLSFKRLEQWKYPAFPGFQYDFIPDAMITWALTWSRLDQVDLSIGWEDDIFLYNEESLSGELKHALRVARLVKHIREGGTVYPVELDTFNVNNCCSCISDGHHRIRALQYLKLPAVPISLNGHIDELNILMGDVARRKNTDLLRRLRLLRHNQSRQRRRRLTRHDP
jgi:hypothetical protein